MTDNSEEQEKDVGYCNPPEETQFEEGNDAGLTHGLFQPYENMFNSLSDEEKILVGEMSKEFVNKYEDAHNEPPGTPEREMIRNLVLDTIKRKRANEYMFTSKDYVNFDEEQRHTVYSRLRRDNRDEMEALGLLETPEAEKQKSEAGWFEAMSNADVDK